MAPEVVTRTSFTHYPANTLLSPEEFASAAADIWRTIGVGDTITFAGNDQKFHVTRTL
jgi:hypothetical protein